MTGEDWISTTEAARRLGCSTTTVLRLVDEGRLAHRRIGFAAEVSRRRVEVQAASVARLRREVFPVEDGSTGHMSSIGRGGGMGGVGTVGGGGA